MRTSLNLLKLVSRQHNKNPGVLNKEVFDMTENDIEELCAEIRFTISYLSSWDQFCCEVLCQKRFHRTLREKEFHRLSAIWHYFSKLSSNEFAERYPELAKWTPNEEMPDGDKITWRQVSKNTVGLENENICED